MESWGRGVPLILENAPDASFIEIGGLFITRIKRPSALEAGTENASTSRETPETTLETGRTTPETSRETTETSTETLETSRETGTESAPPDALATFSMAQKILHYLQSAPASTAQNLAQKLGITEKGIRYHLEQLKKQGKLRHLGSTKAGYWEVIGKDNK